MPISPYTLLTGAPSDPGAAVLEGVPPLGEVGLLAVPFSADHAPEVGLPLPVEALLAHYEAKGEAGEVVEVPVANGDGVYQIGAGNNKVVIQYINDLGGGPS
ncbi:hypothetical protein ACFQ08_20275, partial [Streptosporangium algeriense]